MNTSGDKAEKVPAIMPSPQSRPYALTPQERAAAQRVHERLQKDAPPPSFKVSYDAVNSKAVTIDADHPEPAMASTLLADALGTSDLTLAEALLDQLANVARTGRRLTARELNSVLAVVRGISPRDPIEALLAAQMVAVHNATMSAACNLNHAENTIQKESASNILNKLARTFAAQLEALKRYRSTGEQSIRVQHVNVSANQAVVGIRQGLPDSHRLNPAGEGVTFQAVGQSFPASGHRLGAGRAIVAVPAAEARDNP